MDPQITTHARVDKVCSKKECGVSEGAGGREKRRERGRGVGVCFTKMYATVLIWAVRQM